MKFAKFARSSSGTVSAIAAVAMPAVVGSFALGTEVVYWQFTQRSLQSAADAAAFSAAAQLAQGKSAEEAIEAGERAALASGLDPDYLTKLSVQSPPTTGAYAGDPRAAEVVLNDVRPRMLSSVFTDDEGITLVARSVSRTAGARPACILALHPSEPGAIDFTGSSEVIVDGCDIAANSIASDAIDFSGAATRVTANCVSTVGGVYGEEGNLTTTDCVAPFEGTRKFADPFRDVAFPEKGSCDSGLKSDLGVSPGNSRTVSPGTICSTGSGGSRVSIKGTITFEPGTYYFDGIDLTVNSTATLRGDGVTLVMADGAEIKINGGADIEFSAPSDEGNDLQGILFFGDRQNGDVDHILNGNSATSFTGAAYFPSGTITYSGTTDESSVSCTMLVANELTFTGNSFFGSNCSSLGVDAADTAQVVLIVE